MTKSHNKSIIHTTKRHTSGPSSPGLTQSKFNKTIDARGYDVTVERALRCPCVNRATGQARMTCNNCGSTGWIFVNKHQTRAVIQAMNRTTKYKNWTEHDIGKASITFQGDVIDIAFMDRVVNLDLLSNYSQSLQLVNIGGNWVANTIYFPINIKLAYLFKNDDEALIPLTENADFEITENKFTLLNTGLLTDILNPEKPNISLRYSHHPMFHVFDITRERVASREKDCATGDKVLKQLPINAVCIRAHEMLDRPSLDGEAKNDNTSTANSQY